MPTSIIEAGPKLTKFSVAKLHGNLDISLEITDDIAIFVGINGLGKSTLLNLIFFTLARKWQQLDEYEFEHIDIVLNGSRLCITKQAVAFLATRFQKLIRRYLRRYSPSLRQRIVENKTLMGSLMSFNVDKNTVLSAAREAQIPFSAIESLISEFASEQRSLFLGGTEGQGSIDEFIALDKTIDGAVDGRLLYLPTYRRIEKDLRAIFPSLDQYLTRLSEREVEHSLGGEDATTEFVEFGMRDVKRKIDGTLAQLQQTASTELSNLTGNYLSDVISGKAKSFEGSLIAHLEDQAISSILDRVPVTTLSDSEKERVREEIKTIRDLEQGKSSVEQSYIAHFFARLIEVNERIKAQETSFRQFISICNKYLEGKALIYHDREFKMTLALESGAEIDLEALSSGEKQIVSLFAQILLVEKADFLFFIDEPELSLSVPWQRMLLPDIVETGKCRFLVAATHSPFIFDNRLDPYAIDLQTRISVAT